jgi:hypothetical protein
VVVDSGYDTYTLHMLGTETYGALGTVSSGSDSFTWAQTASDLLALMENAGGTTLGAYTEYGLTIVDQMYENYSDVGNDILGASDSIRGGHRHVHLGDRPRPRQHAGRLGQRRDSDPGAGLCLGLHDPGRDRLKHLDDRRAHLRDDHKSVHEHGVKQR